MPSDAAAAAATRPAAARLAAVVAPPTQSCLFSRSRPAGPLRHHPSPPIFVFGRAAVSETRPRTAALSGTRDPRSGPSESSLSELEIVEALGIQHRHDADPEPPRYPASDSSPSPRPPPFSSLFAPHGGPSGKAVAHDARAPASLAAPAYTYRPSPGSEPFDPDQVAARAFHDPVAETKRALPRDTKGQSSRNDYDAEPPPAYSEGDSPLQTFTYIMSAAGGAASIITQVQQGGPPINAIGGEWSELEPAADQSLTLAPPPGAPKMSGPTKPLLWICGTPPLREAGSDELTRPWPVAPALCYRGTSC